MTMGYQSDPEFAGSILPFSRAIRFHGHICPGLATGYYASQIGMRWLHSHVGANSEITVIAENSGCGIDAVQAITGCTAGNGNLVIIDYGKQAYTYVIRGASTGLRVSLRPEFATSRLDPELEALSARVSSGEASPEEAAELSHRIERVCRAIFDVPGDVLFDIREVPAEKPSAPDARSQEVLCARCGEPVSQSRAKKVQDGYYCLLCQSKL
jgi:formylmethanofuran dehydrogenase subunit E